MGIGMVWVVSKENADKVAANVGGYIIGELVKGEKEVRLV
jgi:phosphoribosylformylglycinamidine cyclo-ligase